MSWYIRAVLAFAGLCAVGLRPGYGQSRPGQIVTGVVVDSATGRPVPAASVQLLPTHLGDLSHEDGHFAMPGVAPGGYTLVVERIGYRPFRQEVAVTADAPASVRVALSVAAVDIGEIVVTGTLSPRARQDVISSVSTVSGAELDRRVAQTIAQMLDVKPGLAVTSLGPTTSHPVIRGLSGDRIVVLEDGQRPGDMSSTGADHAIAVDPSTTQHVEIVRGPMSLLYGSSALGGVVNVVRDEIPASIPHELEGSLAALATTGNTSINGGANLLGSLGNWAWRTEASGLTAGETRTPLGKIRGTDAKTYNFAAALSHPGKSGHGGGSYRFYANDYGVPGGFIGGHQTDVAISMRRHTFRLSSELHRDQGLLSTLSYDGGFTHYHHEETEPSGALGTSFQLEMLQSEVVAKHTQHGSLREGAVGVRAQYRDITTGGTLHTPSTYDYTVAGFAIEEAGTQKLRFQTGLRYDFAHYVPRDTTQAVFAGGMYVPVRPRTFGAVSGSVGTLLVASPSTRIGASLSRAYRTPDFNELYSNGPHLAANSYDVGDPSLKQETGMGAEVFVREGMPYFSGEVAAYINTLNNYIFPSSRGRAELGAQGARPRFQYTNHDARFVGVEGEINAVVNHTFHIEAVGSLVNALFTSPVEPIPVFNGFDTTFVTASKYPPLIPPPQGRVGVRLEKTGFFVGTGVKLVARQNRLGDFETSTAGYGLLDATAGVRLNQHGRLHTITLRGENLLDKEYRDHLSRLKDIMPGPGRNISLLYRIVF